MSAIRGFDGTRHSIWTWLIYQRHTPVGVFRAGSRAEEREAYLATDFCLEHARSVALANWGLDVFRTGVGEKGAKQDGNADV